MKKSIPQFQLDRLQSLYHKLMTRLNKHFVKGSFTTFTKAKQAQLLNRVTKLKQQLERLRAGYKLAGSALVLASALYATPAIAQTGVEFRVSSSVNIDHERPSVAMDADGDFVATWQSWSQDGSGYGIRVTRFNANGFAQMTEDRVNTFTMGNQTRPAAAMDRDGNYVIVWQSLRDNSQGDYGIYGRRYTSAGVGTSEIKIHSYNFNDQTEPSIAMDNEGDFVVTWQSGFQDGSGDGIYAQRFDINFAPQGPEFRVNTTTTGSQINSDIAMDSNGDFVVVWQSETGVYGQRYNANGMAQGSEFAVSTIASASQPDVAMDSDGDFVVAWQMDAQDGSGMGVYAQRYDANGTAQGSSFLVNTYTTSDQKNPSVAMDGDGDFVITWQSLDQDGNLDGIYGTRFNAGGTVVIPEFQVSTYTLGAQDLPSVAMNEYGDHAVIWQSFGQASPTPHGSIHAQRYIQNLSPTISNQTFSVAENSSNGATVGTVVASDANLGQTLSYAITAGNTGSLFAINGSTGQITVAGALNFEVTNSYTLTVQVTDNGAPNRNASATITVNVSDVNEANPSISDQSFSVAENSSNGTSVGTVVASDADLAQTLSYAITAGNTGSVFDINSSTGEITVANLLDYESTNAYTLTVQVTDNGIPSRNSSATITVNITDVSNEAAPSISDQSFTVAENSSNGTSVGTVLASDADLGQTLSYSFTAGNIGTDFAINSSTGEITVIGTLDYEDMNTYTITVQVTDDGTPSQSANATITVNITDVNETNAVLKGIGSSALIMSPNPANAIVHLNLEGEATIKIVDLMGKVIMETSLQDQSFSVNGLKAGTYLVEIIQNGNKSVKKLIKE
ncbi:MAG: cadherin domain-containing protein [Cytophagaceae bacterium]|jgi:hypothetical protein|nr:cadherin domain-containing protein [Cytophagaceae bacterium]